MAALDDLNDLIQHLPHFALLSDSMKLEALEGAQIPDPASLWPGETGYSATYDVYFAACSLIGFLQAQPFVRHTQSEGTGVTVEKPDWQSLKSFYQSKSPILRSQGTGIVATQLPVDKYMYPTDMSGRGTHYGDVNTDLG